MESALSYYRLIPEAIFQITSISTRKTKLFKTDIAPFSYTSIHPRLFWGYDLKKSNTHSFCISDPEKTLLDYLYINIHVKDTASFKELRLNKNMLGSLIKIDKLKRYLKIFSNNRVHINVKKLMGVYHVKF